jgi:5-methylcytosine-specific restriction protein B
MPCDQLLIAPELVQQLKDTYDKLLSERKLPSREQLSGYYQLFRDEFGPSVLQGLDGPALLEKMHNHSNRSSLVYWLEFKNDEELPAIFGSIAGGAANKFGLYRSTKTGGWITGSPRSPKTITEDEAINLTRRHRDQLLLGASLLEQLPEAATDEQYLELQNALAMQAPDVSRLAWGHKYFSMLFPEKLEDYHSLNYQLFHLIKLLQLPPDTSGRYGSAGCFIRIARAFGWPINHLTSVLNELHGDPYRYWRVGSAPENVNRWGEMRAGGFIAIGWTKLGDLTGTVYQNDDLVRLRDRIAELYPNPLEIAGNQASQVLRFCALMREGDCVIVSTGKRVHGIGRVTGSYQYRPEAESFCHQRPVQWLHIADWELPVGQGLRMALYQFPLHKNPQNLVAIERRILNASPIITSSEEGDRLTPLSGIAGEIQQILERKGQVILYGPPGTGKTYWAERTARELASRQAFKKSFDELAEEERSLVLGDGNAQAGLVRMCCFHPAYGYEDFIEGYHRRGAQLSSP